MTSSVLLAASLLCAASAQYAYSVDINQAATAANFNCLKSYDYSTVFVRSYKPDGAGAIDANAVPNVNMAFKAGLGIEVYMTPNPTSSKTAAAQVDEAVNALLNAGVSVRSLWIQVTSPVNWNKNTATNLNFVSSSIQRIRARGIRPGVYTNSYDWSQITNNAGNLGTDVMLWYWNVYASGPNGETAPDFTDFRAFGNWNRADVKQFGQYESVCGFTLNRDVYPFSAISNKAKVENKAVKENLIYAGTIGL